MPSLKTYVLALRPWSLPAAFSSLLVGTALAYNTFPQLSLFQLLWSWLGAISVQCTANVINTYYDYQHGVDKNENSADRTLFDYGMTASQLKTFLDLLGLASLIFGTISVISMPTWAGSIGMLMRFGTGLALGVFYTADPMKLKHIGMGDITIIITFGPLIVESLMFVQSCHLPSHMGNYSMLWAILFSLPTAMIVEAILHANNTRDLKSDAKAGIKTVAGFLGEEGSFLFECGIFFSIFFGVFLLSFHSSGFWSWFLLLPLLSFKMALTLVQDFRARKYGDLCERTGQYDIVFSVLFTAGIFLSGVSI
eukprot:TRINITY_DN3048_c0_g1_i1.p1 TRINITY_DN3048_c0_g1~~TRINITY_DN3048_c0_g1_i1.p1  ORF type:complete len:309 (-),score=90.87 TRINITY_DN3048_c0_g1_i1:53-979(-)